MKGTDFEAKVRVTQESDSGKGEKEAGDRRKTRRTKISMPVRFVPEDPRLPEEVLATVNTSRHGLYFITWKESYYVGMRLRIDFPNWATNHQINRLAKGKVVRVDLLPDGSSGVAVRIDQ